MKKFLVLLLILGCAVPVFAKKRAEENIITPMTQLEKRNFQTRTYNSYDKITVMKALLNTFQDEGYVVYNANSLLGFIYGVKDFDTTDPNVDISKEFGYTKSRLNYNGVKVATLETAANVTEYGNNVRVRVNFKRKLLNEYGNAQFIDDVDDGEFYEEFYSKVNNALSLMKQIPAVNNAVNIKEVIPASVKTEAEEPKETETSQEIKTNPTEEVQKVEEVKESPESSQASIKNEKQPEIEENPQAAAPQQEAKKDDKPEAQENVEQKDVKEEVQENKLSKKELKEQKKTEKQMLKELDEQEKIREKLLKEQEKQEAKVLKELNKVKKD